MCMYYDVLVSVSNYFNSSCTPRLHSFFCDIYCARSQGSLCKILSIWVEWTTLCVNYDNISICHHNYFHIYNPYSLLCYKYESNSVRLLFFHVSTAEPILFKFMYGDSWRPEE